MRFAILSPVSWRTKTAARRLRVIGATNVSIVLVV
jgi:hypothetical protein